MRLSQSTIHPMTHLLHTYTAGKLAERLRERRVVVWYDLRSEFLPFINELRGQPATAPLPDAQVEPVEVGDLRARLCCYGGSFFAIRSAVEPLVLGDRPEPLVIYIPGVVRDQRRSVLLELELAGETYQPQLKQHARTVLRQQLSDTEVDTLLAAERGYQDIVTVLEGGSAEGPGASVIRLIFPQARDTSAMLAAWLADPDSDTAIIEKTATPDLYKHIGARLGLSLDLHAQLDQARPRLWRYLLVNEFRADLAGAPPTTISMIAAPITKEQLSAVRATAAALRRSHADAYAESAAQIEGELGLASAGIAASSLGTIDTFPFEERTMLAHCDTLIAEGRVDPALTIIDERRRNFWVDRDAGRQAQWQLAQLAAELVAACDQIHSEIDRINGRPTDWVGAYTREDGWYRADMLQRQLERLAARMDDEPDLAHALQTARRAHDRLAQRMAEGFTRALPSAGWQIEGVRSQTRIFDELVHPRAGSSVAYILVDALRYEMGVELFRQLAPLGEHSCTPAVAAIPTITRIGMAALMPGAAGGFDVVEERGRLAGRIGETVLPDLPARQRLLKARVPQSVDLDLAEVLTMSRTHLQQRIKDAPLVLVRSQEIDALGELGNTLLSRQVMDMVVANVARAVRRLAAAGVGQMVITADHGHLFADERGDDMKLPNPGGQQVEIHRRCWAGQGGSAPSGTIRVNGAHLGYSADLDFIFPAGLGVFRAGGGLAYHHGGISLQELVVPVVQVRVPRTRTAERIDATVIVAGTPEVLRTRTFGASLTLSGTLFTEPTSVRPVLLAGSEQVGYVGMAERGAFDRVTGWVTLRPGEMVSIGIVLTSESPTSVRVVVQHPTTDAVLGQSDEIRVELGM